MSKRIFFLALILAAFPLVAITQAKVVTSPFQAEIVDTSDVKHSIKDLQIVSQSFSFLGGGDKKASTTLTFQRGQAEVSVSFAKIAKIEVGKRDRNEAHFKLTLTSGKTIEGKIRSKVEVSGSQDFASSYKIKFQYIKTIKFEKKASALTRCSQCKRLFWKKEWKYCPFDGTKLEAHKEGK